MSGASLRNISASALSRSSSSQTQTQNDLQGEAFSAAPFLAQQAVVSALNPPRPILMTRSSRLLLGTALLVASILFLVAGIYCVLLSSYFSYDSEYAVLRTIAQDDHYKYLMPLLIPAGLIFIITNWGGLHYFRHA